MSPIKIYYAYVLRYNFVIVRLMNDQLKSVDPSGKWLRKWVASQKMSIVLVLIFAAIGIGFTLIQPIPFKLLADSVFGDSPPPNYLSWVTSRQQLLLVVAGMNFVLFGLGTIFSFVAGLIQQKIEAKLDLAIQREILGCILVLPYNEPGRMQNGEYLYRLSGLYSTVASFIFGTVITVIRSVAMMLGMIVVLLIMNPLLAAIAFAAMPLLYLSTYIFSKKLQKQSEVVTNLEDKIYAASSETVENVRIVQAFNKEPVQLNRFLNLSKNRNNESVKLTVLGNLFGTTNSLINTVASTIVLLIGGTFVFSGRTSFGALLVFTSYMGNLLEPLQSLSGSIAGWKTQRTQIAKLYDVIEVSDKWRMDSGPERPENLKGEIKLVNVSLNRGTNTVLNDVTWTIPAGSKIALIGASGTGKSTLFNILLRFLAPSEGKVFVDDIELKQFDLGYLRRKIALVDQAPELISATVAENIAFSTLDEEPIDIQLATEAAASSGALEFIQALPEQFNEELSIGSDRDLSGGQKQRISLARAFYKKSPILLFDEPTSALDESSRNHVAEAIKNIKEKTVILVTHDMAILSAVDSVFVLQDGKIIPVEEVGGLLAYRKKLAKEEGNSFESNEPVENEKPAQTEEPIIQEVVEQKVQDAAPAKSENRTRVDSKPIQKNGKDGSVEVLLH